LRVVVNCWTPPIHGGNQSRLVFGLGLAHDPQRRVRSASIERVDDDHANPLRAWAQMGSPEYLMPADVAAPMQSSVRPLEPLLFTASPGMTRIELTAAPQSVNLIRLERETLR
jgi:xylan 1,4-beta-xylosidase